MRRRWLIAGVGAVVMVLGWLTGVGYVDGVVPVDSLVEIAGNDYYLVAGFAILAILLSVPVLASGREKQLEQTEMPAPERPIQTPAPGDGFDDVARRRSLALPVVRRGERREVRERLRTAAVEAVMRAKNCNRADARRAVDGGTWTDDPTAAGFLGRVSTDSPSIADRITALLDGETSYYRRVRRTVAAIAEHDRRREDGG